MKKNIIIICRAIVLVIFLNGIGMTFLSATSPIIGYWPFEDSATGTVCTNQVNPGFHNGVRAGSNSIVNDGKYGKGLFTIGRIYSNIIGVPTIPNTQVDVGKVLTNIKANSGFTLSFWFKMTNSGKISSNDWNRGSYFLGNALSKDGLGSRVSWVTPTTFQIVVRYNTFDLSSGSGVNNLSYGNWYHVALSVKSNKTATFYVNGQIRATQVVGAVPPLNATVDYYLGSCTGSTYSGFLGHLDEVYLIGTNLDASEITNLYQNTFLIPPKPVILSPLSVQQGTTVNFAVSNNRWYTNGSFRAGGWSTNNGATWILFRSNASLVLTTNVTLKVFSSNRFGTNNATFALTTGDYRPFVTNRTSLLSLTPYIFKIGATNRIRPATVHTLFWSTNGGAAWQSTTNREVPISISSDRVILAYATNSYGVGSTNQFAVKIISGIPTPIFSLNSGVQVLPATLTLSMSNGALTNVSKKTGYYSLVSATGPWKFFTNSVSLTVSNNLWAFGSNQYGASSILSPAVTWFRKTPLLALYRFEESSGPVSNQMSVLKTSFGYGVRYTNGFFTLPSGVTRISTENGKALSFNGDSIANIEIKGLEKQSVPFTYSFRLKLDPSFALAGDVDLIRMIDSFDHMKIVLDKGRQIKSWDYGHTGSKIWQTLGLDTWFHIVFVVNQGENEFFINGVSAGKHLWDRNAGKTFTNTNGFRILNQAKIQLADLALFSTALNAAQARAMYENTLLTPQLFCHTANGEEIGNSAVSEVGFTMQVSYTNTWGFLPTFADMKGTTWTEGSSTRSPFDFKTQVTVNEEGIYNIVASNFAGSAPIKSINFSLPLTRSLDLAEKERIFRLGEGEVLTYTFPGSPDETLFCEIIRADGTLLQRIPASDILRTDGTPAKKIYWDPMNSVRKANITSGIYFLMVYSNYELVEQKMIVLFY